MTTAVVNVFYPRSETSKFNMDYYLSTHMPLADSKWKSLGLEKWEVVDLVEGPYSAQAILHFKDMDAFKAASGGPSAPEVFGDVPNFSNEEPVIIVGSSKATRTA